MVKANFRRRGDEETSKRADEGTRTLKFSHKGGGTGSFFGGMAIQGTALYCMNKASLFKKMKDGEEKGWERGMF